MSKLVGFDYEIVYKPGDFNQAVDALSRLHEGDDNSTSLLAVVSYSYQGWIDDLRVHLDSDAWIKDKIQNVSMDFTSKSSFSNRLLHYKRRIALRPDSEWHNKIILEFHDTLMAGHMRVLKTPKRVARLFYWKEM